MPDCHFPFFSPDRCQQDHWHRCGQVGLFCPVTILPRYSVPPSSHSITPQALPCVHKATHGAHPSNQSEARGMDISPYSLVSWRGVLIYSFPYAPCFFSDALRLGLKHSFDHCRMLKSVRVLKANNRSAHTVDLNHLHACPLLFLLPSRPPGP